MSAVVPAVPATTGGSAAGVSQAAVSALAGSVTILGRRGAAVASAVDPSAFVALGDPQAAGVTVGEGVVGGVGVAAQLLRAGGVQYGVGADELAQGGVVFAGSDVGVAGGCVLGFAEVGVG